MKKMIVVALLLGACASQPPVETSRTTAKHPPKAVAAPPSAKEEPVVEATVAPIQPDRGQIVGRPAEGSKFAKLKLGMSPQEVEALIGPPARKWRRGDYKHADTDKQGMRYSYRHEGVLTFTGDEASPALTRILVNRVE